MDEKLKSDLAAERPVKVRPLARASNRSPGALYNAIVRGELKAVRLGRDYRVPPDEARRLLGIEAD